MAETRNLAVFCDFENVGYSAFARRVRTSSTSARSSSAWLVKEASCEEAYWRLGPLQGVQGAHAPGSFELIEIPHVPPVRKNSADIAWWWTRSTFCYTKTTWTPS